MRRALAWGNAEGGIRAGLNVHLMKGADSHQAGAQMDSEGSLV